MAVVWFAPLNDAMSQKEKEEPRNITKSKSPCKFIVFQRRIYNIVVVVLVGGPKHEAAAAAQRGIGGVDEAVKERKKEDEDREREGDKKRERERKKGAFKEPATSRRAGVLF